MVNLDHVDGHAELDMIYILIHKCYECYFKL